MRIPSVTQFLAAIGVLWSVERYEVDARKHTREEFGQGRSRRIAIINPVEMSVVIPCLNEANSLAFCIDKALDAFHEIGVSGEVVVADNGSTDGSIEIAKQHGARVVHVAAKGYGNALRAGIEAAAGQFVILGDADDSYDFSEIPKFVAKWREGYELVMGNRLRGNIKPGAMPWHHRYIGTPVMSGILNTVFSRRHR